MRIRIIQDDTAQNPRKEFDNVGTMVHWHRRYDLGDRKLEADENEAMSRGGFKLLARYLRRFRDAAVILKLGLLDHSGLHMWAGGGSHWSDSAGWDSGTVGFIFCTRKQVQDEWAGDLEKAETYLKGEVETYDQYLRGDVYGFVIEHRGEEQDSCWGFYGADPHENGMTSHWDETAVAWWKKHGARVEVEYPR